MIKRYRQIYSATEYQRITEEYNKLKIQCKHCGHKMVLPVWVDKRPCSWCGYYVYRNKKLEFKENMKKLMKVVQ